VPGSSIGMGNDGTGCFAPGAGVNNGESRSFHHSLHASSAHDADIFKLPFPSVSATRCWQRLHTAGGSARQCKARFLVRRTADALRIWHVQVRFSAGRPS